MSSQKHQSVIMQFDWCTSHKVVCRAVELKMNKYSWNLQLVNVRALFTSFSKIICGSFVECWRNLSVKRHKLWFSYKMLTERTIQMASCSYITSCTDFLQGLVYLWNQFILRDINSLNSQKIIMLGSVLKFGVIWVKQPVKQAKYKKSIKDLKKKVNKSGTL